MITNKLSTKLLTSLIHKENLICYGVCGATLPAEYQDNLDSWIKHKFNAKMDWIARNPKNRTCLPNLFPWAKSVLMVADNYYLQNERTPNIPKISRYAWGEDYHIVLKTKLNNILKKIKKTDPEIRGKIFVDSGPVMEKAFAIESGLGWQGKNTTIIIPNFGSFCFLGVIILSIDLPRNTNKPKNQCGLCTDCIKSCPTKALDERGVLDANKCISYFSIEKKDIFTKMEREWLNDWLYGCDICQDICQYNKKWAKTSFDQSYHSRIHLLEKSPKEWKELTEYQFNEMFNSSVFKRLKFNRFRRNLLAVIENQKSIIG